MISRRLALIAAPVVALALLAPEESGDVTDDNE